MPRLKTHRRFVYPPGKYFNFYVGLVLLTILSVVLWPPYLVFSVFSAKLSATRLLLVLDIATLFYLVNCNTYLNKVFFELLSRNKIFFSLYSSLILWRIVTDVCGDDPKRSLTVSMIEILGIMNISIPIMMVSHFAIIRLRTIHILMFSAAIVLLIGIAEAFAGLNVGAIIAPFSDTNPDLAIGVSEVNVRDGSIRIKSLFSHPILLSQFLGALLPVILNELIFARTWGYFFLGLANLAMTPLVILQTGARSGVLVAILSSVFYLCLMIFTRIRRIQTTTVVLIIILMALLFSGAYVSRDYVEKLRSGRTEGEISSSQARDEMIDRGLKAVARSPLTGFGHGHSAEHAGVTDEESGNVTIDNYYLSTLLDAGYIGLGITLLLFVEILRINFFSIRYLQKLRHAGIIASMAAAASSIMFGQYIISSYDNLTLIFMSAGLAVGASLNYGYARRKPLSYHRRALKRAIYQPLKQA